MPGSEIPRSAAARNLHRLLRPAPDNVRIERLTTDERTTDCRHVARDHRNIVVQVRRVTLYTCTIRYGMTVIY